MNFAKLPSFTDVDWNRIRSLKDHKGKPLATESITGFLGSGLKSLILLGNQGAGKTLLSKCLYRKAYMDYQKELGRYCPICEVGHFYDAEEFYQLLLGVKKSAIEKGYENCMSEFKDVLRAYFVCIDDLGIETQTEAGVFNQGLYGLLNKSVGHLVFSSNLSLENLEKHYKKKILSRLIFHALVVVIDAPDYRASTVGKPIPPLPPPGPVPGGEEGIGVDWGGL